MIKAVIAVAFIALNFYTYRFLATDEVRPPRRDFDEYPLEAGAWSCAERAEMEQASLNVLGATDYFLCEFRNEESAAGVGVYFGYHATQIRDDGGVNAIHPPEHCLPGSGWDIIDARVVNLDLEGLPPGHGLRAQGPEAKRFVIAKGKARQLVYFWYQSQGRVLARNEDVILYRFWGRARNNRTDGSLVRFTIPIVREDVAGAEEQFREVASLLIPRLTEWIPN